MLEIEGRAARNHRKAPSFGDIDARLVGESNEIAEVELFIGVTYIDKMMGKARAESGIGLSGPDVHAAIDLHRIGGNDLRWKTSPLAYEQAFQDFGFPGGGWTEKQKDGKRRFLRKRGFLSTRGILPHPALVLQAECDALRKYLARAERYDLTVVLFHFRIADHGELVRSTGSSAGDLVHILIVFYELLEGKNHQRHSS
jgi:hypothetical protein